MGWSGSAPVSGFGACEEIRSRLIRQVGNADGNLAKHWHALWLLDRSNQNQNCSNSSTCLCFLLFEIRSWKVSFETSSCAWMLLYSLFFNPEFCLLHLLKFFFRIIKCERLITFFTIFVYSLEYWVQSRSFKTYSFKAHQQIPIPIHGICARFFLSASLSCF